MSKTLENKRKYSCFEGMAMHPCWRSPGRQSLLAPAVHDVHESEGKGRLTV